MPHFSDTPTVPLPTSQANQPRLATKNRYVVQVLNGMIKKTFQYFEKTIQSIMIPLCLKISELLVPY